MSSNDAIVYSADNVMTEGFSNISLRNYNNQLDEKHNDEYQEITQEEYEEYQEYEEITPEYEEITPEYEEITPQQHPPQQQPPQQQGHRLLPFNELILQIKNALNQYGSIHDTPNVVVQLNQSKYTM
jgi:hypothetical protein